MKTIAQSSNPRNATFRKSYKIIMQLTTKIGYLAELSFALSSSRVSFKKNAAEAANRCCRYLTLFIGSHLVPFSEHWMSCNQHETWEDTPDIWKCCFPASSKVGWRGLPTLDQQTRYTQQVRTLLQATRRFSNDLSHRRRLRHTRKLFVVEAT